jgi:hypothetical protein
LKGVPLDQGVIEFAPKAKGQGTQGGAVIQNGKYSIAPEKGLAPGVYVVRISSGQPGTKATDPLPGEAGPPAVERIPEKWNTKSTQEVEVKAGGSNTFNFPIP